MRGEGGRERGRGGGGREGGGAEEGGISTSVVVYSEYGREGR